MLQETGNILQVPEEHRQRMLDDETQAVSSEEYEKRVKQFLAEAKIIEVSPEQLQSPSELVDTIIEEGYKCVVCSENGIDKIADLRAAFRDRNVRTYQVVSDFDIPYTPPFTNEGSSHQSEFDGCVLMFPNGLKEQPTTAPERTAEISDPVLADELKSQAEEFVKTFCTWRSLLNRDQMGES